MVSRCDAMLCCWFAVGLIEEELVEKGRGEMAEHRKAKGRASGFRKLLLLLLFF